MSNSVASIIDYDELHADYLASLLDTLRGFSPKVEGLELWVPDENLLVSLKNLLDATARVARRNVAVWLGTESAARLDAGELLKMAVGFGDARVTDREGGLLLEVNELSADTGRKPGAAAPAVVRQSCSMLARTEKLPSAALEPLPGGAVDTWHVYASALIGANPGELHMVETGVRERPGCLGVRQEFEGVCLHLSVDVDTHVIARAAFSAAKNDGPSRLLGAFCRLIEGLPIVEASDHGVARLEYQLRDPSLAPPVPGIITPEAAHTMFLLPSRLIRGALSEYRKLSGFSRTDNDFDPRPAKSWMDASLEERTRRLMRELAAILPPLGLCLHDVRVAAIRYDTRVELGFSEAWNVCDKQRVVMTIERELKLRVDPRLEVYVEERKDKNKMRRLAVVGDTK